MRIIFFEIFLSNYLSVKKKRLIFAIHLRNGCRVEVVEIERFVNKSESSNIIIARGRAAVARRAHNPKVGGSIPPLATKEASQIFARLFLFNLFCKIPVNFSIDRKFVLQF